MLLTAMAAAQLGVLAADAGRQVADPFVEMQQDGFGSLRRGQHGPDEGPHLRRQVRRRAP